MNIYSPTTPLSQEKADQVGQFLFQHLDQYGDTKEAIQKAIAYAMGENQRPGGLVITLEEGSQILGCVVVNQTGMESYIPENILVYIATDQQYRGKGIGKKLMETAIENTRGDIALHVEPDNPAKRLYERIGFTNKYLEMRLAKS